MQLQGNTRPVRRRIGQVIEQTRKVLTVLVILFISTPVFAQEPQAPTSDNGRDLFSMDLESLFNMKVTTASKFEEKLSDAPGVMSVVSQDELKRFGALTLKEVLERVPGLTGTSAYFTDRSMVAAHGDQTKSDGEHILILINGRPTREILEGGVISDLLESFPVNVLDRIEVIKGPGSVLYGSNAFSAVINLITQKADSNGFVVTGFGGNEGALGTSAQMMFKHGDLSVIGAIQAHQKPDWSTSYRFPFVDILFPEQNSTSVQNVTLRDRGKGSYVGLTYKGLTVMSTLTEFHSAGFLRGAVGENRLRRGFGDIGYGFSASPQWDMNLNLTYTRTTLNAPQFPNIRRDSNEIVVEWTNTLRLGVRDRLTLGTLYNHIQGRETYFGVSPSIVISKGERPGGAVYGQLNHHLYDRVELIGGFQANKVDTLALNVVPRVGLIWNPSGRVSIKALYSKAFRAPSINETTLNHPALEGNPNLVPEQVGTVDIGMTYQGRRVHAGINYFRSRQTDNIAVDTSAPRWRYRNFGEATFRGFELDGKYYMKKNVFLEGSTLYQANDDGNGTKNITPVANFAAKAGLSYQSEDHVTLSVFANYQGHVNYPPTLNPAPSSYYLVNSHFRLDLSKYVGSLEKGRMALFVHGDNLANKEIWMPDWGGNSGDTIPVNQGRTVYLGLEVSLNNKK